MESGTEGLSYEGRASQTEVGLEIENIYKRIEILSSEQKARLIHRMIVSLTVKELADALDEIAIRLRDIGTR